MVFFDEAGNSGDNLLDADQPLFTLLSHDFDEKEAALLLKPIRMASNAKELHFKNLKKYSKTQKAILECINHELIMPDRAYYYTSLKEFMVVAHIVDQLVELVLNDGGIDIYKGGVNLSTANLLYIMGNNAWDKEAFKKMCSTFVDWFRSNDDAKGDLFYSSVRELYKKVQGSEEEMLVGFILLSERFRPLLKESHSKFTLDSTLSCFVAHCNVWAKKYNKPFDIVFDTSKQINYWREFIQFLTTKLPTQEVGYGSRKHKYPLLINSLKLVDSSTFQSIQLADILASSLNYAYTNKLKGITDPFVEQILKSKLSAIQGNAMWPTTAVTPEELDMTDETGINALNFIAEYSLKEDKKG
jgi:hypothetical protein